MSKTLVRKGISFVQNSCLVAGSLSESTSEPGRRHERVRASNARARPPRPGRKKQRTHPSQQSLKAVLSRDERKPAVSNGVKDACTMYDYIIYFLDDVIMAAAYGYGLHCEGRLV